MSAPKNAIPTPNGWIHEKTGELLKSQKLTSTFIAAWHGITELTEVVSAPKPAPKPRVTKPKVQTLREAPAVEREVQEEEKSWHDSPAVFAPQELKED